jgi:hypothetical protein
MTVTPEDVVRLKGRAQALLAVADRRQKIRWAALTWLGEPGRAHGWLAYAEWNAESVLSINEGEAHGKVWARIVLETLPLSRVLDLSKWSASGGGEPLWHEWPEESCAIVRRRMAEAMVTYADLLKP